MSDVIHCPHCGEPIPITKALQEQVSHDLEKKFQIELEAAKSQADKKEAELKLQQEAVKKQQAELENQVQAKTEAAIGELKKDLWHKAQQAALEKNDLVLKDLKEQLDEQRKKNEEAQKQELELRKQMRAFEDAKREWELQMVRKLDEERKLVEEKLTKDLSNEHRLKELELRKQLEDTQKALEDAKRKASQGSQQTQGEVLELDLENTLRATFIKDVIEPVGKGVHGADIIHKVCNGAGSICGVLLWEIKQTKHWTEGWITKFKDDLRAQKANVPILVTMVLPKEIEGFGLYQGVWITQPAYAVQLAIALRNTLISVDFERSAARGRGEKMELLYQYIASHEFRQRVEALVEVYAEMQSQITKEQTAYTRIWQQRQMQLHRLLASTAGLYGEIQGLVGSTLPEIKGLELGTGEGENPEDLTLF